jgi:hypothetical protein
MAIMVWFFVLVMQDKSDIAAFCRPRVCLEGPRRQMP